jgi:hypothetical protein
MFKLPSLAPLLPHVDRVERKLFGALRVFCPFQGVFKHSNSGFKECALLVHILRPCDGITIVSRHAPEEQVPLKGNPPNWLCVRR